MDVSTNQMHSNML